jgi:Flp pilus assembly protein TadG
MRLAGIFRDQAGASAVEFALTAPVFIMLVVGSIEFSLALWTQMGLQHGVEMAARCASINPVACGDIAAIQSYAAQQSFGLDPPVSTFTVTMPSCGKQVSAAYPFPVVTSFIGSVTITAQACSPA